MSELRSPIKRRKLDHADSKIPEQINSLENLRSSLFFRQTSSSEVKQGITKFKEFLQSTAKPDDPSSQHRRLQILRSYCEEQSQAQATNSSCLRDLLSSWSFAVEIGHDSLLSSIPSVLALFLKTISGHLDFRDLGLGLCKCLLEKDQLRLFDRGLTATRTKEHLISPCIRLLTEIVGFDGGSVANRVFALRSITFKRLDLFLEQRKGPSDAAPAAGEKPSLRRIAQRYILRNLAFQSTASKQELIAEGKLLRKFLHGIRYDNVDIIGDIIQAIEKHIIDDRKVSRSSRSRLFDQQNLKSLASLYRTQPTSEDVPIEPPVPDRVHSLLLRICTDVGNGVLMRQSGWYPPGFDPTVLNGLNDNDSSSAIDMGLDAIADDQSTESITSVTNFKLARFFQSLNPDSDKLQGKLLLAAFQAAPELVANYFSQKTKFMSEPKPTSEWLGQSAWLFRCIDLPVPKNYGWAGELPSRPPPIPTMLENILPRPLDRATLARCMNLNVEVVTLFATRTLIIAFQKLRNVISMLTKVPSSLSLWLQAAARLKTAFGQRVPPVKDVIAVFQRNAKGLRSLRSSAIELIELYYESLPEIAMREAFNISSALSDALSQLSLEDNEPNQANSMEEVTTLLRIAIRFPQMKWWNKLEGQNLTCFTSVLRAIARSSLPDESVREVKQSLSTIAQEHGMLVDDAIQIEILIASLHPSGAPPSMLEVFDFLDNCLTRLAKAPVHYQDLVYQLLAEGQVAEAPNLLIAAIIEQWPFACKKLNLQDQKGLVQWIASFFGGLIKYEVVRHDFKTLQKSITAVSDSEKNRSILRKAFMDCQDALSISISTEKEKNEQEENMTNGNLNAHMIHQPPNLEQIWRSKLSSQRSPPPRRRLDLEDLEAAFEEGILNDLMKLLCSQQEELRLQAVSDLSRFGHRLQQERDRIWRPMTILVGEIVETAKDIGLGNPFPSVLAESGLKFVEVLRDPLHFMYAKVNRFLNKGPTWDKKKTVSYWIDKIILRDSEGGDSKVSEITWLLGILVNGLQTIEDLELYRHASVFERTISLYDVATTKDLMRELILELIFRAIEVGGSQILATRAAILNWLQVQKSRHRSDQPLTRGMLELVQSHCTPEQLEDWKGTYHAS